MDTPARCSFSNSAIQLQATSNTLELTRPHSALPRQCATSCCVGNPRGVPEISDQIVLQAGRRCFRHLGLNSDTHWWYKDSWRRWGIPSITIKRTFQPHGSRVELRREGILTPTMSGTAHRYWHQSARVSAQPRFVNVNLTSEAARQAYGNRVFATHLLINYIFKFRNDAF